MADLPNLHHPWLVAVWPGMGGVALTAGYYLLAKLHMHGIAEFEARELFDVDHVEVKGGLVQPGRRPRNRFFVWTDPKQRHDLVVFLGEAQPPLGKYLFCQRLVEFARELGVERVFTFAAMPTPMHPAAPARVFAAATDAANLAELKRLELTVLDDGHIGGLNGVLLGAAVENGLHGACLLGEMPHVFAQLPFPKASLAILETFAVVAGIDLDFDELAEQARQVDQHLGQLLERMQAEAEPQAPADEPEHRAEPADEDRLAAADRKRIDGLFDQARQDRAKAFELKRELDRLGAFKEYEDRFLDLFKKAP